MLPSQHKLTSPTQFRRTIKSGQRAGSRTVVVHAVKDRTAIKRTQTADAAGIELDHIAAAGPRFGLVVSKAVGNAVVRHRTSRRLRHVCAKLMRDLDADQLPATADVVIRALPASGEADSARLERDLVKALRKAWRT